MTGGHVIQHRRQNPQPVVGVWVARRLFQPRMTIPDHASGDLRHGETLPIAEGSVEDAAVILPRRLLEVLSPQHVLERHLQGDLLSDCYAPPLAFLGQRISAFPHLLEVLTGPFSAVLGAVEGRPSDRPLFRRPVDVGLGDVRL